MEYIGLLIVAVFSAAVATVMLFPRRVAFFLFSVLFLSTAKARGAVGRLIGPQRPNLNKSKPFECGVEPIALPAGLIPVHFYVMAMLFVVFDVELVFLFPWAVVLEELGWFGLLEMALFLGIVVAGFVYAWKKGALEWER